MALFSFPFGKKEKPKYFLALILREDKINAVLFEETGGKVKIISQDEEHFQDSIENATEEELLALSDKAISTIEQALSFQIDTHQTIFGLKENWSDGTTIKKEYLAKLKKVCDSLGLAPIGFMVIPEAIAHFLQKEEGAPVSAILVEVGRKKLIVSLIRAGRVIETKTKEIEGNVAQSVDEILKHFDSADILPSRIVLFDDSHREDLLQEFIAHQWGKSLPFLHVPQTSLLPKNFAVQAVIVASASQMGFEILGKVENMKIKQGPRIEDEEKENQEETKDEAPPIPKAEENTDEQMPYDEVSPESIGFSATDSSSVPEPSVSYDNVELVQPSRIEPDEEEKEIETRKTSVFTSLVKTGAAVFTKLIPKRIPSFGNSKKMLFVPVGIVCLLLLLVGYVFAIHAKVVLNLKPKTIEQTQDVLFSTTTDSDFSKNTIHAELVKTTQEGSVTDEVNGKKEVGDKTKGTVTLYSRIPEEKKFPQGTVISFNNLDFTFDSSVTVASTSADASSQPTTAKINVTATQIGKESNLPSGTKFTIGNFSSSTIIAKNDSAFSGGSKKEVTVISKDDVDKLSQTLSKNLESKAKDDLGKVVSSDSLVLPAFISEDLIKKDLDKQIGQEAKNVTLKGTVEYVAISYKKEDLIKYGREVLKNKLPNNLTVAPNGIRAEVDAIKQKNDKQATITTKLLALLLPNIDTHNIAKDISGKSFLQVEDMLLKLPQVDSVSIALQPNIPFLPKILPRLSGNITVTTKVNE